LEPTARVFVCFVKRINFIHQKEGSLYGRYSSLNSTDKRPRQTFNSRKAGTEQSLPAPTRKPAVKNKSEKLGTPKARLDSESTAIRQKKIADIENQLTKRGNKPLNSQNFMEESSSQTLETTLATMTGRRHMVAPGTRDAPKFSSNRPEELRRFLRMMEDLWKDVGIVDNEEKKTSLGKYADQESEEEWTALESFGKGRSWDDFKTELLENYPEAAEAERGTPYRLRKLCRVTTDIQLGDLVTLFKFRRAFMAEAKKLSQPPAVMSNRELVEMFLSCLSGTMASAVLQYLGTSARDKQLRGKQTEDEPTKNARRPEDRYDLEEVTKAAVEVSEGSQGMFALLNKTTRNPGVERPNGERGVLMFNQPLGVNKEWVQKLEEIAGVQAQDRDKVNLTEKKMDERFNSLETMIKTLLAKDQGESHQERSTGRPEMVNRAYENTGNMSNQQTYAPKQWGKSMDNERCFYCGKMGHFQADCEELKSQVRSGQLKVNQEGRLRLRDGSHIPGGPGGSTIKERVDRHYARRPSQVFYGEYEDEETSFSNVVTSPNTPRYPQQYVQNIEDPDARRARLEKLLDLKEKEEALELRQLKLERDEKKLEKNNKSVRTVNVLDLLEQLTDDEIVALKAAKAGFQ
jgi:hypothetical protein